MDSSVVSYVLTVLDREKTSSNSSPPAFCRTFDQQVSYKTLPRQQFGNLQSKLFPHYFRLQSLGSLALLGLYHRAGKLVNYRTDRNLIVLSVMAVTSSLNWLIVGPWTTAVMKKRHRRERIEGKDYNAADVSFLFRLCENLLGLFQVLPRK